MVVLGREWERCGYYFGGEGERQGGEKQERETVRQGEPWPRTVTP